MSENPSALEGRDILEVLDPRLWPTDVADPTRNGTTPESSAHPETTTNEALATGSRAPQEATTTTQTNISTRKRPRNDADGDGDTEQHRAPEFTGRDGGRGSWMEEVVWLIAELKQTITTQSHAIGSLKAGQEELKEEQRALVTQNKELQQEIRTLRTQLHSASPSWASVAASGTSNSAPSNNPSGSSSSSTRINDTFRPREEPNCIRISTAQTQPTTGPDSLRTNTLTRYLPANAASNRIQEALQEDETTRNAQVAGVGTTRTGYLIRFKDDQSAAIARNNTGWLQKLGNETRVVKPRFGVVVHRTPTDEVPLLENKEQSIAKITHENELNTRGFQISDLAWLKKKDSPLGTSASLAIWFESAEAAEWATRDGLLFGARYIGSIEPYQIQKKRCHRCLTVGHLAWSCKEAIRCKHCAGEHDHKDCPPGTPARCVDCGRNHATGSKECRNPPQYANYQ
jgi:hypothetical protein